MSAFTNCQLMSVRESRLAALGKYPSDAGLQEIRFRSIASKRDFRESWRLGSGFLEVTAPAESQSTQDATWTHQIVT
jgi:hypothetical protein